MNLRKLGSIASFAAASASILLVACGPSAGGPAPVTSPVAPATATPKVAVAAFDQQFIDMMVPHHEGAVEMARIAQQRAEHPEIRLLADDILRSQDAEISRMRQWRQAWYGSSFTPPMSQMPMVAGMADMGHAGQTVDMAADVERLRGAPGPFDLAFIDAMVPHHQSAIEAARVALQQSARPEIQVLAVDILEAQQREIGQMRAWRLGWGQATTPAAAATPATGVLPGMTMPVQGTRDVPGEDMGH
jgi:uncharacterized protein (DUF305 family)